MFIYKRPHNAVLINYPSFNDFKNLYNWLILLTDNAVYL
jgi:hypothetical protein